MGERATATFEVRAWEEKPYDEALGGVKLTRARVSKAYHGDIEGEGNLEYLMVYRDGGSATFVGMERVTGRIGSRAGGFVLKHTGSFESGTATVNVAVVPGSGTGDLQGLRGEGHFAAKHEQRHTMTLDYSID